MKSAADVAIIGGGILGLANALAAARRGLSVALFERSPRASGASIRNFGMIWPIGQSPGAAIERALRARRQWINLAEQADFWLGQCGSLHLAYRPDELAVLEEFAAGPGRAGYECRMLDAAQAREACPAIVPDGLLGALHSPLECAVDPRQAIARLSDWLAARLGVRFHFATPVRAVDAAGVHTATGEVFAAGHVVVCSGSDFETLFPEVFAGAGLRRCKLQMMRTGPQPAGWRIGPHLAGGLTLCHYPAFADCLSLPRLRQRIEAEMPEYVRFGIHVMASHNNLGEVVIGDSHEYDADIDIFDKPVIDALILDYLRRMVRLPDEAIAARCTGIYAKHPSLPVFTASPLPNTTIMVAPGGAGMTLSFALAEDWWQARG